ncbi:MAG: serine/threonine dehydratase [Holophagaceae bacterium]
MTASTTEALLTTAELRAARARLHPFLRRTPLLALEVPTPAGPRSVAFKLEILQYTGAFKVRGAFNALLQTEAPRVLACSGGNHGLAVAHAASALKKHATIVVPRSAARLKVDLMRRLGAEVREVGESPAEAFAATEALGYGRELPLIHPYDQREVIAGQATLGLELRAQAPEVAHWLLAVGGGGLAAGCALALEGHARVVPVEPEGCPQLAAAQAAGRPVAARADGVARTALGPPSLGTLPWAILRDRVGPSVLVDDAAILEAQAWLWRAARLVVEPGGAAALAALRSGAWVPPDRRPVGVVLCGGNADALPVQ